MTETAYKYPLIIYRNGIKETHRIIPTMWKMDTKEYATLTNTKQITATTHYGCSKCCDNRYQLTDPNRISFHHLRSNDHILQLAGLKNPSVVPQSESDICRKFKDWDPKKGMGYTPPVINLINSNFQADPHYTIATDLYHASKNIFQQIFVTFNQIQKFSKEKSLFLFFQIKDFMEINHTEAQLTQEEYKGSGTYLNNISLESAPMALVKQFIYIFPQLTLTNA